MTTSSLTVCTELTIRRPPIRSKLTISKNQSQVSTLKVKYKRKPLNLKKLSKKHNYVKGPIIILKEIFVKFTNYVLFLNFGENPQSYIIIFASVSVIYLHNL